jgi:hypothetical protein
VAIVFAVNCPPQAPAPVERANRLEDILNRHVTALPSPRRDGTAVQDETRDVETCKGHRRPGNRLVAPDEDDERVEVIRPRDELDRIRYDLAADERHPHAVGAHRDAVGHRDGVELHGGRPCGSHAGLDRRGEAPEVKIARTNFNPGVRDPDEGLPQVVVGEADRLEHRPGGRAVAAARNAQAAARTNGGRGTRGHSSTVGHHTQSVKFIILHFV